MNQVQFPLNLSWWRDSDWLSVHCIFSTLLSFLNSTRCRDRNFVLKTWEQCLTTVLPVPFRQSLSSRCAAPSSFLPFLAYMMKVTSHQCLFSCRSSHCSSSFFISSFTSLVWWTHLNKETVIYCLVIYFPCPLDRHSQRPLSQSLSFLFLADITLQFPHYVPTSPHPPSCSLSVHLP